MVQPPSKPASSPLYQRALLKISGESLRGPASSGIDPDTVNFIAGQVKEAHSLGVQIALVIGGGNIWRGETAERWGMERATADYAGMLATVINALALQDALEDQGVDTRTERPPDAGGGRALHPPPRHPALGEGPGGYFAAGTGNPYMSTDTASALRALEIEADVLLMAKFMVDGVYDSDPRENPSASRFDSLEYLEVLDRRLEVMDLTALTLCQENEMPIVVFDMFKPGNVGCILNGENVGTTIGGGSAHGSEGR